MVDYMIENDGVVIVVNEVKKKDSDLSKGAAQNIMQMHSALEVSFLYLISYFLQYKIYNLFLL